MGVQWFMFFALITATVNGFEFDDEQYYEMPHLFHLDDYNECLASRRGAFCLGSFDLLQHSNDRLLRTIQNFSSDKFHFNHTHIHRGYCLSSSRCANINASSLRGRFERCVENVTRAQYGLTTNLTNLEYCRASKQSVGRLVDGIDLGFAYFAGAILLMNLIGTAYDILRHKESKPNKYLITWSLRVNWGRLTANYSEGDPRLTALRPVQGMKVLTLFLIMMAHSVLAYHITYLHNPQFLEKASHHPLSAYFQNGTSIVQTFIMASCFLMAYNLLLHVDGDPKRKLSLKMFPKCLMHRITRISPVYMFVIGFAVTWWVRWGDGPLWGPLVGAECSRCRDKWWTQALFLNNLIRPDVRCLIHTWFLAVDMQLYVICSILTLVFGRNIKLGLKVFAGLFLTSIVGNFLASYYFQLRPMVTLMFPEYMRTQFYGETSFKWLYQAPWDSFPAAMVGLFVAFLHYHLQNVGYKPSESMIMRIVYRLSVPCMWLWVIAGYFMKEESRPVAVALYAALDRPVFTSMTAFAMYGFFNQIDSVWWRFLSWRGWELLGRLSLPAYLVHWPVALSQLGYRAHLSPASIHEIGGHYLWTVFVTYWLSLPLHLVVELPMQKFLQAFFS